VAIARAMVLKPAFIVADEPTSMLDASISFQIFNLLLEVRRKMGVAILFITHSISAARYLCDRIAVIYRGRLMETGPADRVINTPLHPYTKALIDARPGFGATTADRHNTLLSDERAPVSGEHCPFYSRCSQAVTETCATSEPPLVNSGPDHIAACFYI
jgi:peptide/nickel transport system ATP-binding protein